MINENHSFKEIKNDESFIHEESDENFLHKKYDENMIYFDTILQDPCATPVPLTLDFLKVITNDFSEEKVLGHGGFGVVYKGVLGSGKAVALKRLRTVETNLSDEQYQKELRNLFGLQNNNIVKFKGYCADSSQVPWPVSQPQGKDQCVLAEIRERVLCFEYLPNKSLRQHISDASCGLEWLVRYEIIKGICSGLHYLHTERDIAHMDLKPENILLDDNMVPKIGDFGTSRLFAENQSRIITENCVGSKGYMPPEYINRGMISKKADIFSFGVIVLELLTGSRFDYPERKELFSPFTEDVVQKWRNRLPNADYSRQVRMCSSIALSCVDASRDRRPTTGYIIRKLDEVQDPSSSWSWVQKFRKIATEVGAVVLMLLNPSSWWSWVVVALKFIPFVVTLHAVRFPARVFVLYQKHQCSTRPREILFTIGAILAAALVLLTHPNSIGSWTAIALKLVTMAGVTLLAIGVVVLHVVYQQHVLEMLSGLFFSLVAPTAAAAQLLAETSSLSTTNDDDDGSISPNGKCKRKITSWIRGTLLGSGSLGGVVYEGISDEGAFFAVMEVSLLDQGSNAQQSILALEQEIALLSQFEHENIVQYYGIDKDETKLYIFIELVTQGSLASIYQKYILRESQVFAYTRQILNGLVYLHERNVVHRDIKCANILVHANGSVKLAYFGLGKEFKLSKINMLRSCKGSVYWMAPEVINPEKTYGPSADIWSLGCTVLEMLTGQVPFPNVEWTNAFFMIGRGEQPSIPNNLSKEAQDFISQCVRVDPEKRPSAAQLLEHPFVNRPLRVSFERVMRGALLGSGSLGGVVYEGISDAGAFLAVKEVSLLDQGINAQQSILALEKEIALLSQFEHENIVQYYGIDKDETKLKIFIELVTQGSLASIYKKYILRESQVFAYTRQILNGLVYLHERNVVHRDIKCANILVHANGSVKLADFGLAKEFKLSQINMLRSCKGSVYWMAPEVINPKKTYGPSADIWSLGCTVLEMLTGQIPFPDLEWTNAFFMIGRGEQPPIPNSLSKEAQDFIAQCVRVDPKKRPSAAQLLEHPFVNRPPRA